MFSNSLSFFFLLGHVNSNFNQLTIFLSRFAGEKVIAIEVIEKTKQTKPPSSKSAKPRTLKDKPIEEILKQEGSLTVYVPTTSGAMKVRFEDHLFVHHYTRNLIARYRCALFEKKKCPASIVVKEKSTYPCNVIHNHPSNLNK